MSDEGDFDGARQQMETAAKATAAVFQATQAEQQGREQQAGAYYQTLWEQEMQERIRVEPDLGKPDSELCKGTQTVLSDFPGLFERIPPTRLPNGQVMGGFSFAAEVAKLRQQAGAASGLEATNKQLLAEIAKYKGLTALNRGGTSAPSGATPFDKMTSDQQEEAIMRMAREHDLANNT